MADASPGNTDPLIAAVQALYTQLAVDPPKDLGWGIGKESARSLGYNPRWLDGIAALAWDSAAPVGNPFSLGPVNSGETVVDLGCGAGTDLCIAALLTGKHGRAVGIDITPAMIAKAQENARLLALNNVEFHIANIAALPLEDASADVVISNGAINLSAHKPCVFREVFRILRPGGRFQFADMVREGSAEETSCNLWANCVSGTIEPERYLDLLKAVGFSAAELVSFTGYRTAPTTIAALFRARKPLATST
jgi:arsenite methyltransferase